MQLRRPILAVFAGMGAISIAIAGCEQPRDFSSELQPSGREVAPTTQPMTSAPVTERSPDPYVPTPERVVNEMLRVAEVSENDVVYDLGSGDGRILISAARNYGARGVGVEMNSELVQQATSNAQQAGVGDRVEFRQQDLFETDLSDATVVTLYLLPEVNLRLRPKLLDELRPGTRIVSHAFNMGDWEPEQTLQVEGRTIYVWTVPEHSIEPPGSSDTDF